MLSNSKVHGGYPHSGEVDLMEHLNSDKLVFTLNGKQTFVCPRIEADKPGQWPFDQPFYLLIDMQLGGAWVGAIDEAQLPVQMEIDWVKVYQKKP